MHDDSARRMIYIFLPRSKIYNLLVSNSSGDDSSPSSAISTLATNVSVLRLQGNLHYHNLQSEIIRATFNVHRIDIDNAVYYYGMMG